MFYDNFQNKIGDSNTTRGITIGTTTAVTVPAVTTVSPNNNRHTAPGVTMPPVSAATSNSGQNSGTSREQKLEQVISNLQNRLKTLEDGLNFDDDEDKEDKEDEDKEDEDENDDKDDDDKDKDDVSFEDDSDEQELEELKLEKEEEGKEEEEEEEGEKKEGFKNKKKRKGKKTEGFHNKNLGFGIFTNNIARNILRTALIVLFVLMIQDKYVKDAIMKSVKNTNMLSKNLRDSTPLILISLVVFAVISLL